MIIAGNFKSFHTRKTTLDYFKKLNIFVKNYSINDEIIIFPPFCAFDKIILEKNIFLGSQNFYPALKGSFTGEITLEHLNEFHINYVLIGHSERRSYLKENQDFIVEKFNFAKDNGKNIIYCIGEPKEIRDKGFEEVKKYLLGQLDGIDINMKNLTIAYEPIWAIGTGLSAKIQDIQEVLDMLKDKTNKPLLYGGSVNDKNAEEILSLASNDGVLIGSFSLEVENFCKILEISKNIKN